MPRLFVPVVLIAALAACSADSPQTPEAAAAAAVPPAPSGTLPGVTAESYPQALSQAYAVLARSAAGAPAETLQAKAAAAEAGAPPEPETAEAVSPDLHRAEASLRLALANNAGAVLPREAATAQAAYDCWLLAERTGAPAAVDCRAVFGTSIRELWARS